MVLLADQIVTGEETVEHKYITEYTQSEWINILIFYDYEHYFL